MWESGYPTQAEIWLGLQCYPGTSCKNPFPILIPSDGDLLLWMSIKQLLLGLTSCSQLHFQLALERGKEDSSIQHQTNSSTSVLLDVSEYIKHGIEIGFKVSRPHAWGSRDIITKIGPRRRGVRFGRKGMKPFRWSLTLRCLHWDGEEPTGKTGVEVSTTGDRDLKTTCEERKSHGVEKLQIQKKFREELEMPDFKGKWRKSH